MPATLDKSFIKISTEKAKHNKLFYFVTNVVVYRESDGRCLLLKRSETAQVHPGKFCTIGGKLEHEELDMQNCPEPSEYENDVYNFPNAISNSLMREVREEAGVKIGDDLRYIGSTVFVRPDGIPVVLVKFAAKYMSGEVKLEAGAFTDFVWVNSEEIEQYDYIGKINKEVRAAIEQFGKK